mmetsp:Transcript_29372/g.75752  ORF Transcript_29372/g.75752 Transcript_29372/m.75752 type:complete len:105 (+) Transcript_29372:235-549(+)
MRGVVLVLLLQTGGCGIEMGIDLLVAAAPPPPPLALLRRESCELALAAIRRRGSCTAGDALSALFHVNVLSHRLLDKPSASSCASITRLALRHSPALSAIAIMS